MTVVDFMKIPENEHFTLEINFETHTIGAIKDLVAERYGVNRSDIKLIAIGRALSNNNKTLKDHGLSKNNGVKLFVKIAQAGGKSSKRKTPEFMKLQSEVIKMIVKKEQKTDPDFNYPKGIKVLKKYVKEAIGKEYVKDGDITWLDALKETKKYLSKK